MVRMRFSVQFKKCSRCRERHRYHEQACRQFIVVSGSHRVAGDLHCPLELAGVGLRLNASVVLCVHVQFGVR